MSVRTFKFSSPGIFANEIDKTQLFSESPFVGPVVIGRFERGIGNRPVTVNSLDDFAEIYGDPVPGVGTEDPWREGFYSAPTYAAYAAKAYLRNNGPVTVIRLLGEEHPDVTEDSTKPRREAGWHIRNNDSSLSALTPSTSKGAYGLFLVNSGSNATHATGTLAAVFYVADAGSNNHLALSSSYDTVSGMTGSALGKPLLYKSESNYVVEVPGNSTSETIDFNFDKSSDRYIRKVFHTDPSQVNTEINETPAKYWLGETYEDAVAQTISAGDVVAVLLGLKSEDTGAQEQADHLMSSKQASTPWIVSQYYGEKGAYSNFDNGVDELFRLVSLDGGSWPSRNLKVSVTDLKMSTNTLENYPTFTVSIRRLFDSDAKPEVIERYTNCNLDPESSNYIAKKIGDQYLEWSEKDKMYNQLGEYPNISRHFRVEVETKGAAAVGKVPFGFYGPPRYKGFTMKSGSVGLRDITDSGDLAVANSFIANKTSFYTGSVSGETDKFNGDINPYFDIRATMGADFAASFGFPTMPLRGKSTDINPSKPENTYWGIITTMQGSRNRKNHSMIDLARPSANGVGVNGQPKSVPDADLQEYSFYFTLDNVSASSGITNGVQHWEYETDSANDNSYTYHSGTIQAIRDGINKFTLPVVGGFDGLDIQEREPFGQHVIGVDEDTELESSAFYTLNRALDVVSDPEDAEMNLLVMPGVVNRTLTDRMIDICESRADALAIVDLEGGYVPGSDRSTSESADHNLGSVTSTVTKLQTRSINSSYACAYYPWVKISDRLNGASVWVPPSVVALGTMANSEATSELWFAPAGFNRGGLSNGASGLTVTGVRQKLKTRDRDELYDNNINPIASFPAEGIVVFGQKTLQVTPSALDRINVRRLMIYVKREISLMARDVLFDQNVQATWQRFLRKVEPFLTNVKIRFGLSDFLVVLDETTTTPDLVDRNIMYAKIFLKPARAIEFIALDFVLTNTGADFLA